MVLIIVGFTLYIVYDRQEAKLDAALPFIRLLPDLVTIDEKRSWDLMGTVREVFSSHIGGALAGTHVISRAVQVIDLFFVLSSYILIVCRYNTNLSRY